MIKKIIPSTLIGRSIIIIFVPIIIIVLLTSFVFYQTSWSIISKRLTESVAADINVLVKLINNDLTDNAVNIANQDFKMKINIINDKQLLSSKFTFSLLVNSNLTSESVWVELSHPINGFTPLFFDINSNIQLLVFSILFNV